MNSTTKRIKYIILALCLFSFSSINSQSNEQNPQINKIDVLHYDIAITLFDTTDLIKVNAIVKLYFKQNTKDFYLELKSIENNKGMILDNVNFKGNKLDFTHKNNKIYFNSNIWQKNDTIELNIKYHGIPADGLIISNNKYGKRTFFGDNWPNRAHNWLPVIDHPSDKASIEFKIRAPKHYQAIASGRLIEKKYIANNYKYYHFSTENIPLPTKVMVIGLADFDIKNYGEVYGIPISSMVFHPAPTGGLDDYRPAMDIMKYFIDTIGDYSYLKLANVQSKTRYGGMENAGNIFYYENSINGNSKVESLVAHEIAHQWFGNSATEKNWHHIWLSEGFATYLTDLYLEHKYGIEKLKERMIMERTKVLRYNSRASNPVIDTTIANWNRLLNPNSYEKGAWFLHMLRNKIGDYAFFKTLRNYYKKYKNSNALTSDFRKIAEEQYGQGLKQFFDQWLRTSGYPNLEIIWNIKDNLLYVNVKQLKWNFDFELPIRLLYSNNKDKFDYNIDINCPNETFVLPIPLSQNTKIDFSNADFKLIIDPKVLLLYSAKVNKSNQSFSSIPIIKNGDLLKKGDLLFQDIDCGPLCDAIESVTFGVDSAHFSHVGIVANKSKGKTMIIEAIGSEVKVTELNDFLKRSNDIYGRPKVVVGRVKNTEIIDNAIANLEKYIGKQYDDEFDINNDNYYCSELVYFTFKDNDQKNIFTIMPMTYKNKKTGKYFESWQNYFNKLNIAIPEGKPGINPGGISRSDKLKILYKFGNPEGW